jgi:hypothetical protein
MPVIFLSVDDGSSSEGAADLQVDDMVFDAAN